MDRPPMMLHQWRKMETAPRDGKAILVAYRKNGMVYATVAMFIPGTPDDPALGKLLGWYEIPWPHDEWHTC